MSQKKDGDLKALFLAWLEEAKRLRSAKASAEADFFLHLQEGERNESMWRAAGYETFSAVLKAENLAVESRYRAFLAAAERFGIERVRAIGVDQIRMALPIPPEHKSRRDETTPAAEAIVRELTDFVARNHTPPSEQQARAIRNKHWDPPARPRLTPDQRVAELREENEKLRAEVKALRQRVQHLEKENARLERMVDKLMGDKAAE